MELEFFDYDAFLSIAQATLALVNQWLPRAF
jgi:hypothetical protein